MPRRRIYDMRMNDGSRHFASLPETYSVEDPEWHRLRTHAAKLAGSVEIEFVTDDLTEAWLRLAFRGQEFELNNQCGEWWLFVRDPGCSEELLECVLAHFEQLTGPSG